MEPDACTHEPPDRMQSPSSKQMPPDGEGEAARVVGVAPVGAQVLQGVMSALISRRSRCKRRLHMTSPDIFLVFCGVERWNGRSGL